MATPHLPLLLLLLDSTMVALVILHQIHGSTAQQTYVNNKQLDCNTNYTNTLGFVCHTRSPPSSCLSYVTFRTNPIYNTPITVGYLLNADPSQIAQINQLSDVTTVSSDTLLIVPLNCSCNTFSNTTTNGNPRSAAYYQHNASYDFKTAGENYFSIANNTYEGLTTCQSMIAQNPYNFRQLVVGMRISIPLRCACPSSNQTRAGFKYLLTYLVTWGDSIDAIADMFGSDNQSVYLANNLTASSIIFPFTPILVPLKSKPAILHPPLSPPPSSPKSPAVIVDNQSSSSSKWVVIGAGVGGAALFIVLLFGFLFCFFRRRRGTDGPGAPVLRKKPTESSDYHGAIQSDSSSWPLSTETVRFAVGSLTLYKFEELQKATGFFDEANRIMGSVYRGSFKGDEAAVKVLRGDVSEEINILKQINHSRIVRLSGFCKHDGNTYLVYEYANNGSLSDWLHLDLKAANMKNDSLRTLDWKQRVQIAYDVADALNYLHNYSNPPYIHKNLKSSNILLDSELRAKVSNFGLARTLGEDQDLQLTRHVVGPYGYMAPEYIENGLVTAKLDVYSFGVLILETLSGKEAASRGRSGSNRKIRESEEEEVEEKELLSVTICEVLEGENVREKLKGLVDPCLGQEYPIDLAYSLAQLAKKCVARDLNSRPAMAEVFMTLSKILSSSLDWDPSAELEQSRSLGHGR